jgi:phosphohistidine phosphatase
LTKTFVIVNENFRQFIKTALGLPFDVILSRQLPYFLDGLSEDNLGDMRLRPWWFYKQSGVVPYRVLGGRAEVLLITSRRRGRWIIPKGIVEPGMSALESARKEAYEEAGIEGELSPDPIGEYKYDKWGGTCTVKVFKMEVRQVSEAWPESGSRRREWMTIETAARAVEEPRLRELIRSIEPPGP